MATETKCQTSGAVFHLTIKGTEVGCTVTLPFPLNLSEEQAELLEANMYNMMELVLAPYFLNRPLIKE